MGIGFTESRLKLKYLPEAHTDFIISIVGEELGFVAVLSVIVAYLLLAFFGFRIGSKARTRQGMLIAFGMCTFMTLQATINLGVICGALPTKGMPAPMISYGGSSLLACMIAVAIVFSVAVDNTYPKYDEVLHRKFVGIFMKKDKKNSGK
jgi:cell division protein FtsW